MPTSVNDVIVHCQKQIKKEPPEEKLLHYLSRLDRLRITIEDLKDTHIGRTVNQLSRHDGQVGHVARKLVKKWKKMVSAENPEESADSQSSSSDDSDDDGEEGEESDHQSRDIKNVIPVVNKYHDVNGNKTNLENSHQIQQHGDDSGSDSGGSDRLCIAVTDEMADGSKSSKNINSGILSPQIIKKETILPSDSEESATEDHPTQKLILSHEHKNESYHHRHQKESHKNRNHQEHSNPDSKTQNKVKPKIKAERLSESDRNSDGEENRMTQRLPNHNNKSRHHKQREHRARETTDSSEDDRQDNSSAAPGSRSSSTTREHSVVIKNESEERHKKRSHSDERREKHRSERDHRRTHEENTKRHSKEKESSSKKRDDSSSNRDKNVPVKIKLEPLSSLPGIEHGDDESSKASKHYEKSKKRSKDSRSEKEEKLSKEHRDHHKKKKSHRHELDDDSDVPKRTKEGKIRSKGNDSSSDTSKRKHEKESSSSKDKHSRKKDDRSSYKEKHSKSSSPDRKKIKLEKPEEVENIKSKSEDRRSPSKKPSIHIDTEIDSTSGVKFDDLLGCLDTKLPNKQRKHKDHHKDKDGKEKSHGKHSSTSSSFASSSRKDKEKEEVTKLVRRKDLVKDTKVEEKKKRNKNLESIIAPTLNISPNYKPSAASALLARPMMPPKSSHSHANMLLDLSSETTGNYWEDSRITLSNGNRDLNADEDALATMMSSRNQRTKVYSGNKAAHKGVVPSLFDMCMQVIQENIHELGYTGGVPFDILKPALERATSEQLMSIELNNSYLIGETDELWKFHCKQEFQGRQRQEMETWRELFERCFFERDEKFAVVRKKMLKKADNADPTRKAKLAYVEAVGGPKFNPKKMAMIKNGARTLKMKEEKGARKNVMSSASASFNNPTSTTRMITEDAVLINPDSRGHGPGSSSNRGGGESTAKIRHRKAPLMAKTMSFIRKLQRR